MKINILLVIFIFSGLQSYEQAGQRPVDSVKLNLAQYLLSTHSVINSALTEKDPKAKTILKNLASKYLSNASAQFSDLQKNKKLDQGTIKSIRIVIEGYSDLLKDRNFSPSAATTSKLEIFYIEENSFMGSICL